MVDKQPERITITIPDDKFADAIKDEVHSAIARVLAVDGIIGTDIKNDIINTAVEKLTSRDEMKRYMEDIVKKIFIDKATSFLIRTDEGFKRKFEAHAHLYKEKDTNRMPDDVLAGLYLEYIVEKFIKSELEDRVKNMEVSLSKHARPPAAPVPPSIKQKK